MTSTDLIILCSECFSDHGLSLDAFQLGRDDNSICPNCSSNHGRKLGKSEIASLAFYFFVRGTVHRTEYGGAPAIQFNEHQKTSVTFDPHVASDAELIAESIGVGFFHYGPRLWMVGEVEPLKDLMNPASRKTIFAKIFEQYTVRPLLPNSRFYRLRINPLKSNDPKEYDSPPDGFIGAGRLDSPGLPVLYGSQDLEVCIHECRATVDDLLYFATLSPTRELKILDLTDLLKEEGTEFESLDMAIHMLFLAGGHSYDITRELAKYAQKNRIDGIAYPSYFSIVRTGAIPFETVYGISVRRFPSSGKYVQSQIIRNLALFGRPISEGIVQVDCINKLVINKVGYDLTFGPTVY